MTNYFIDTNCLLSYITDRNPEQQDRIAPYFSGASVLKHKVTVIQNVITEFVYVCLRVYKMKPAEVREIIKDFLNTPGMEIEHSFPSSAFLHLWPGYIEDYGDAVLAAAVQTSRGVLLTFDRQLKTSCAQVDILIEDF
jgi:predicted nucleic-acid-binding protein